MIPTTLTRFDKGQRSYSLVDTYKGCLSSASDNCVSIESHMNGLIAHLKSFPSSPTGWSHAAWKRKGCTNDTTNFVEASAIALEYQIPRDDTEVVSRLYEKARKLGWMFSMLDTQNKKGNTVTISWYLTQSVSEMQYARLASIFAAEMDEYQMADGSLAVNHIFHVHGGSICIFSEGTVLDPVKEIRRTAKLYQNVNARKYEGKRPAGKPITLAHEAANEIEDESGLFVFYETKAEKTQREAEETMRRYGFGG